MSVSPLLTKAEKIAVRLWTETDADLEQQMFNDGMMNLHRLGMDGISYELTLALAGREIGLDGHMHNMVRLLDSALRNISSQ